MTMSDRTTKRNTERDRGNTKRQQIRSKINDVFNQFSLLEKSSVPESIHRLKHNLLIMMEYNYPNQKCFDTLSQLARQDLKDFCSQGYVLGAVQTSCISCGGILFHESYDRSMSLVYKCLNKGRNGLDCRDDTYYMVEYSPWKIPPDMEDMKKMEEIMKNLTTNLKGKSIEYELNFLIKTKINDVDLQIKFHLSEDCFVVNDATYKILKFKNDYYSYFVINRPDLSDGKYSFTQILVPLDYDSSDTSNCLLKSVDKVYATIKVGIQPTTVKEAMTQFKEKFQSNTGIDWHSWCNGKERKNIHAHCFYFNKYMIPLKINYRHKKPPELKRMLLYK